MGARQDRQADDVDVLLERRRRDHLGRLAEARVDDLEALVAEAAGEDLGAAVVAVEAGLGDEHLDRAVGHGRIVERPRHGQRRRQVPQDRRRREPWQCESRQAFARVNERPAKRTASTASTPVTTVPIEDLRDRPTGR